MISHLDSSPRVTLLNDKVIIISKSVRSIRTSLWRMFVSPLRCTHWGFLQNVSAENISDLPVPSRSCNPAIAKHGCLFFRATFASIKDVCSDNMHRRKLIKGADSQAPTHRPPNKTKKYSHSSTFSMRTHADLSSPITWGMSSVITWG